MEREGVRGGEAGSSVVLKHLFVSDTGLAQQLCVRFVRLCPFYKSEAIWVGVVREKIHQKGDICYGWQCPEEREPGMPSPEAADQVEGASP